MSKQRKVFKVDQNDLALIKKLQSLKDKYKMKSNDELVDAVAQHMFRQSDLAKEQRTFDREIKMKEHRTRLKQINRFIAFKQGQIKAGEIVEKDESVESGKKPEFLLENNIDDLEFEKFKHESALKNLKEEQEKDDKGEKDK